MSDSVKTIPGPVSRLMGGGRFWPAVTTGLVLTALAFAATGCGSKADYQEFRDPFTPKPTEPDRYEPDNLAEESNRPDLTGVNQLHSFHEKNDIDFYRIDLEEDVAILETYDLTDGISTIIQIYEVAADSNDGPNAINKIWGTDTGETLLGTESATASVTSIPPTSSIVDKIIKISSQGLGEGKTYYIKLTIPPFLFVNGNKNQYRIRFRTRGAATPVAPGNVVASFGDTARTDRVRVHWDPAGEFVTSFRVFRTQTENLQNLSTQKANAPAGDSHYRLRGSAGSFENFAISDFPTRILGKEKLYLVNGVNDVERWSDKGIWKPINKFTKEYYDVQWIPAVGYNDDLGVNEQVRILAQDEGEQNFVFDMRAQGANPARCFRAIVGAVDENYVYDSDNPPLAAVGVCSEPSYTDQSNCESNGKTWSVVNKALSRKSECFDNNLVGDPAFTYTAADVTHPTSDTTAFASDAKLFISGFNFYRDSPFPAFDQFDTVRWDYFEYQGFEFFDSAEDSSVPAPHAALDDNSALNDNPVPGKEYRYTVVACDDILEACSAPSEPSNIGIRAIDIPAPQLVYVSDYKDGGVDIVFKPTTSVNCQKDIYYTIYRIVEKKASDQNQYGLYDPSDPEENGQTIDLAAATQINPASGGAAIKSDCQGNGADFTGGLARVTDTAADGVSRRKKYFYTVVAKQNIIGSAHTTANIDDLNHAFHSKQSRILGGHYFRLGAYAMKINYNGSGYIGYARVAGSALDLQVREYGNGNTRWSDTICLLNGTRKTDGNFQCSQFPEGDPGSGFSRKKPVRVSDICSEIDGTSVLGGTFNCSTDDTGTADFGNRPSYPAILLDETASLFKLLPNSSYPYTQTETHRPFSLEGRVVASYGLRGNRVDLAWNRATLRDGSTVANYKVYRTTQTKDTTIPYLKIWYHGNAQFALMTLNNDQLEIELIGQSDNSNSQTINLKDPEFETIRQVALYLNQLEGYSAQIQDETQVITNSADLVPTGETPINLREMKDGYPVGRTLAAKTKTVSWPVDVTTLNPIATLGGGTFTYNDSAGALSAGQEYYYTVVAFDSLGNPHVSRPFKTAKGAVRSGNLNGAPLSTNMDIISGGAGDDDRYENYEVLKAEAVKAAMTWESESGGSYYGNISLTSARYQEQAQDDNDQIGDLSWGTTFFNKHKMGVHRFRYVRSESDRQNCVSSNDNCMIRKRDTYVSFPGEVTWPGDNDLLNIDSPANPDATDREGSREPRNYTSSYFLNSKLDVDWVWFFALRNYYQNSQEGEIVDAYQDSRDILAVLNAGGDPGPDIGKLGCGSFIEGIDASNPSDPTGTPSIPGSEVTFSNGASGQPCTIDQFSGLDSRTTVNDPDATTTNSNFALTRHSFAKKRYLLSTTTSNWGFGMSGDLYFDLYFRAYFFGKQAGYTAQFLNLEHPFYSVKLNDAVSVFYLKIPTEENMRQHAGISYERYPVCDAIVSGLGGGKLLSGGTSRFGLSSGEPRPCIQGPVCSVDQNLDGKFESLAGGSTACVLTSARKLPRCTADQFNMFTQSAGSDGFNDTYSANPAEACMPVAAPGFAPTTGHFLLKVYSPGRKTGRYYFSLSEEFDSVSGSSFP